MEKHNVLYYIFLWDYERNILPLEKVEQRIDRIAKKIQTVEPKQHSPPINKKEWIGHQRNIYNLFNRTKRGIYVWLKR